MTSTLFAVTIILYRGVLKPIRMNWGVRDYIGARDAVESAGSEEPTAVHYECRSCGRNLEAETETCPACGGEVAGHLL